MDVRHPRAGEPQHQIGVVNAGTGDRVDLVQRALGPGGRYIAPAVERHHAADTSSSSGYLDMAVPAGHDMHQIDGGISEDIGIIRIKRGDALLVADLSQAHRVAIRQRCQFESRNAGNHIAVDFAEPADVYHPNFQICHYAYHLPAVLHISAIYGHKRWRFYVIS